MIDLTTPQNMTVHARAQLLAREYLDHVGTDPKSNRPLKYTLQDIEAMLAVLRELCTEIGIDLQNLLGFALIALSRVDQVKADRIARVFAHAAKAVN